MLGINQAVLAGAVKKAGEAAKAVNRAAAEKTVQHYLGGAPAKAGEAPKAQAGPGGGKT